MKHRFGSLQSRIVLSHLFAILIAAGAVAAANYLVLNRSTNLFEARTLRAHADTIAPYLKRDASGAWRLDLPQDLRSLYSRGFDGLSFRILDAQGNLVLRSGNISGPFDVPLRDGSLFHLSQGARDIYGIAVRQLVGGSTAWIMVVQNTQHPDVIFDDIVSYYLARVGWLTVVILALVLAADLIVIRGAMGPVVRASRFASMINPKRLDIRLPVESIPSEVSPLVMATNKALDRLEQGIKLQREFTADAAHELRTPLAVLRARLDGLPNSDAISTLKHDVDAMTNAVGQLLEMADLEDIGLRTDQVIELQDVAANVVAAMAPVAIAHGKEVALQAPDENVTVIANDAMVFRAIRNLVDNAIKYTPIGTAVEVRVAKEGRVQVMDRGPGIPESERNLVFRRFWRARRDNVEGVGLGLAIVARIAELTSATIEVSDCPGGGTSIAIQFRKA